MMTIKDIITLKLMSPMTKKTSKKKPFEDYSRWNAKKIKSGTEKKNPKPGWTKIKNLGTRV
jgi:hypothetical protein